MNLTLVSIHIDKSPLSVPLGAAMIASALKKKLGDRLDIKITEFYLSQEASPCDASGDASGDASPEGFAADILKTNPDFAGFSIYLWNRNLFMQIASILKEKKPGIVLFAGGPDACNSTSERGIDFIIPGEGEESAAAAVTMLLRGKSIADIKSSIVEKPVISLENLNSPYLDKTLDLKNYEGVLWELSRGCPYKCDFCFESRGTEGVRNFPFERLEQELKLFVKSGVDQIFILDPTFNSSREKALKMLNLIKKIAPDIHFTIEARAEFVDRETAALFASITCSLQIGLQSSNASVLKKINRTIDRKIFSGKILLLHEAGVTYGFDLIYGLPGDTLSGFFSSIDYALSLIPNHVDIFPLSVLPGTRLKDNASKLELTYQENNPYRVIASPTFSRADMKSAASAAQACDLFYNKGRAVPWFSIVLENLNMKPSELFNDFALWIDQWPGNITAEEIIIIQLDYLSALFGRKARPEYIKIASDLVRWFGYTSSLMEGAPDAVRVPESPAGYKLNPELYMTEFNYDIENLIEVIESGITDFSEIAMIIESGKKSVIYMFEGELNMRYLTESEYLFLADSVLTSGLEKFISDALRSGILLSIQNT